MLWQGLKTRVLLGGACLTPRLAPGLEGQHLRQTAVLGCGFQWREDGPCSLLGSRAESWPGS